MIALTTNACKSRASAAQLPDTNWELRKRQGISVILRLVPSVHSRWEGRLQCSSCQAEHRLAEHTQHCVGLGF